MTTTTTTETPSEDVDAPAPSGNGRRIASVVVLVLALAAWAAAVPSLRHARLSYFGLLVAGSPLLLVSIVLTAVGFLLALAAGSPRLVVASSVVSIVILRLTSTVATAVPLYPWTYKHIAVADYIQSHGSLARTVDIYNNWPGLFTATAWFSHLSGLSAMTIAHWYTPAAYLLELALVIVVARAWGGSPLVAATAGFIVTSFDWVGQGYFSPQFTALLLGLGVLAFVGLSRQTAVGTSIIIVLFGGVSVIHQLTPYWLLLVLMLLAVRGRIQPRWLPVVCTVIAIAFLAFNWTAITHYHLVSLNPFRNVQSSVSTTGVGGQQVTSWVVRIVSVTLWGLAGWCAVRAHRRGEAVFEKVVLAFASVLILGAVNYGGEAVYRVLLFSLPGVALFIAPELHRSVSSRRFTSVVVSFAVIVGVVGAAQGVFGPWSADNLSKDEIAATTQLLDTAPTSSYLSPLTPGWPGRTSSKYVRFADVHPDYDEPLVLNAKLVGSNFTDPADYDKLMATVQARNGATYLIISKQMAEYARYFGYLPVGAIANLERQLRADNRWQAESPYPDVTVYRFSAQ